MTPAIKWLYIVALGVWVGSIIFFSFFIAPTVFKVLKPEDAARLQRALFPKYYLVGMICAGMIGLGATAIFTASGSNLWLAVVGNGVYGFGIGATIAIRSAAFSDVFGGHNFGAIFGIIAIAYPAGGIIVMNAGGIMYDRIGNYWPVYGIVMVSLAAWSAALMVAGPRRHGLHNRLESVRSRLSG